MLLLEFGQVFRGLFVDQRDLRQKTSLPYDLAEHENSKVDICLCLSILLGSSISAKTRAFEENLVKKVIEICEENVQAIHLAELQKFTTRSEKSSARTQKSHGEQMGTISKQMFESQFERRYRYAQVQDIDQCEREVVRMLKILKHLLYQSGDLLIGFVFDKPKTERELQTKSFVSQNAQTKVTAKAGKKVSSLGEKMMALFGTILE